jgi:putative hydrolase of the HAD superfamily
VLVGDRPEVDVGGAAAAGLRAVQVVYPGGPDPHPDADATVDRADLVETFPAVLRSL